MARLDDDIDALFKLPLSEFIGARKTLIARLKKSGDKDEAQRVNALSKPSVSAWTVNQLFWNHRDEFDELIATGQRVRKAQTSGKVANMREALDARREALSNLSDLAPEILREAGRLLLRVPSTNGAATIFNVRAMTELKSPLFSLSEISGGGIKVKNLTDAEISNAVCITSAGISDLFTLAPGEERQVALNMPQAIPFWNWYTTQISANTELTDAVDALSASFDRGAAKNNAKLQEFLDRGLMTDAYKALEHPLLFGFVDTAATEIEIGNSQKQRSKSFYLVHL